MLNSTENKTVVIWSQPFKTDFKTVWKGANCWLDVHQIIRQWFSVWHFQTWISCVHWTQNLIGGNFCVRGTFRGSKRRAFTWAWRSLSLCSQKRICEASPRCPIWYQFFLCFLRKRFLIWRSTQPAKLFSWRFPHPFFILFFFIFLLFFCFYIFFCWFFLF